MPKSTHPSRPSAGLSKAQRSAIAKKASAGKDFGKGEFSKVAAAAGGGEKGRRIAAAQFWRTQAKKAKGKKG